jgi:hypothetical protein
LVGIRFLFGFSPKKLMAWAWLALGAGIGLLGAPPVSAQRFPIVTQQKFYGTAGQDNPTRMVRDAQGNLYIFGSTDDRNGRTDCLIMKVDPNGNLLWKETWGGVGFEQINDGCITPSGEIYFAGVTGSEIPHPDDPFLDRRADYYIGRISPEGDRLWTRTIGGSGQDVAYGICPTNFDGIAVTGMSWSRDHDVGEHPHLLNNQWFVILNKDGRILRSKVFGGKKNDWGNSITLLPDGGFVLGGITNSEELDMSQSRHNGDVWIMKLDFAGNMQWTNILKRPYEDILYRIVANKYGLCVAAGSQVTPDRGKQFWIMKFDDRGRLVIDKVLGANGFEELLSVDVCEDGGIIAAGYSDYLDIRTPGTKGLKDVWVLRTNAQGEIMWEKSLGGPTNEIGVDVMEFEEGVMKVLCQKANTFNNPQGDTRMDAWVVTLSDQPCQEIRLEVVTDITTDRVHAGTPIKFVNRSALGDRFEWDFGDGTRSTERSPIKIYRTPGVYTVKLTAIINETCRSVYFYPKPVIISP